MRSAKQQTKGDKYIETGRGLTRDSVEWYTPDFENDLYLINVAANEISDGRASDVPVIQYVGPLDRFQILDLLGEDCLR